MGLGAKFDVVDTFAASEFGNRSIEEILLAAIQD
jgi:hypothetical protein